MKLRTFLWASLLLSIACGSPGGPSSASDGMGDDDTNDGDDIDPGTDPGEKPDPACTRAESVAAITVLRPEPFDVVIVADNSGSISWSRDSLSQGLRNLLSLVHGQDVRFFLLSPTQYGQSSEDARDRVGVELVTYADIATGMAHGNAVTEYTQTCTDQDGTPANCADRFYAGNGFNVRGTWNFTLPDPIAVITPEMVAAEVEAEQQKISDAVLGLGTQGAQMEQPICTLSRYITQAPELLPKHAVFLVLSDEDDVSSPADCLKSYSYDAEPAGSFDEPCQENCDFYSYEMSSHHALQDIGATCTPLDDQGQPRPDQATTLTVSSTSKLCIEGKTECDAEDLAILDIACGEGKVVSDCKTSCGSTAVVLSCGLGRSDTQTDLCTTSFVEAGITFANMNEYCELTQPDNGPWMDCVAQGYKEDGIILYSGPEVLTPVIDVETLDQQVTEFHELASAAFGEGGYFVESVVFAPQFQCEPQSGQSYGTRLSELASSEADVFPICGDYAPALGRIESFAQKLVSNEFQIRLASDETILAVSIQGRSGELRALKSSDYQYDADRERLTVNESLLLASDVGVDVTIEDSCIEILR
jgi:hypothetical protein